MKWTNLEIARALADAMLDKGCGDKQPKYMVFDAEKVTQRVRDDLTGELEQLRSSIATILETIDSIPFHAGEAGLGLDECEAWRDRLQYDLRKLVGSRRTCIFCGEKYGQDEQHDCFGEGYE